MYALDLVGMVITGAIVFVVMYFVNELNIKDIHYLKQEIKALNKRIDDLEK